MKRSTFRSKPRRISPEERRARKLVRIRAADRCEGCGRPGPAEWAHRVSRAHLGPWCPSNGIALCGDLTGGHAPTHGGGCHPYSHSAAGRQVCEDRGWILRSGQDPAATPALLYIVGLVLLTTDGNYAPIERAA